MSDEVKTIKKRSLEMWLKVINVKNKTGSKIFKDFRKDDQIHVIMPLTNNSGGWSGSSHQVYSQVFRIRGDEVKHMGTASMAKLNEYLGEGSDIFDLIELSGDEIQQRITHYCNYGCLTRDPDSCKNCILNF